MPIITNDRFIMYTSSVPGAVATVPTSNNHLDGTWTATDIYDGELFINVADKKFFTRCGNDIIEITNQTLAKVLTSGNQTDGTDILMTGGSKMRTADNTAMLSLASSLAMIIAGDATMFSKLGLDSVNGATLLCQSSTGPENSTVGVTPTEINLRTVDLKVGNNRFQVKALSGGRVSIKMFDKVEIENTFALRQVTVDDTPVSLFEMTPESDSHDLFIVEADVSVYNDNTHAMGTFAQKAVFKNLEGVVSQIGTTTVSTISDLPTATATLGTDGSKIVITGIGEPNDGTGRVWDATIKITKHEKAHY